MRTQHDDLDDLVSALCCDWRSERVALIDRNRRRHDCGAAELAASGMASSWWDGPELPGKPGRDVRVRGACSRRTHRGQATVYSFAHPGRTACGAIRAG